MYAYRDTSRTITGLSHTIDIECDLWPEITYAAGQRGYVDLNVTVVKDARDNDKIDKVINYVCV
jgi:hypothetical protein